MKVSILQTARLLSFGLVITGLLLTGSCKKDISVGRPVDLNNLVSEDLIIVLNPSGLTPLSAELRFNSVIPVNVSITIEGEEPLSHTFDDFSTEHRLPILGLYPGRENNILVMLTDVAGNFASTEVSVTTEELPSYFPEIVVDVTTGLRQPGWTLAEFGLGLGTAFRSNPIIFDESGTVRWYMDLSAFDDLSFPVKQKSNGNLLVSYGEHIYEYDMLGRQLNDIFIPGYLQHHETREMPNGNLLVAVDKIGIETVEDHVIEVSPNGTIVQVWDFREILDMDRMDLVDDEIDWFHNNAVWYSEADDCIIASGRNQGVVKVTRENELVWILAPHQGWGTAANGTDNNDFLLTAIDANGNPYPDEVQQGTIASDQFDWTWGQHAPVLLENGNIFILDNGFNRHFLPGEPSYTRAVEYRINEEDMTIEEIWQYGKERGVETWAPIISDVDVMPNRNRIMHAGIVFADQPYAKIVEVAYPDGAVAYEVTLKFRNELSTGELAWGGLDLSYRSERIDIYP